MVRGIRYLIKLFADDTAIYVIVSVAAQLTKDIDLIHTWAKHWPVSFKPSKTESLLFSTKTDN